jgi:hypothetical protein
LFFKGGVMRLQLNAGSHLKASKVKVAEVDFDTDLICFLLPNHHV